MTRKDYIILSRALKAEKPAPHWAANKHTQWDCDVRAIAGACRSDNARFDTARFLSTCDYPASKES